MVNIYAREDGTVDTEPMDEILLNGAVDVSDETVLVNVIAAYADQSLRVPVYTAVYQGSEVSGNHASYAGRIVYNLAAQDGSGFGAYTEARLWKEKKSVPVWLRMALWMHRQVCWGLSMRRR